MGDQVPLDEPGVYVVAMSDDPDGMITSEQCPVSGEAVDQLLGARPELLLDGARPTRDELATRLAAMWLPSETVLYVGLASASTSSRVAAYYRTPLGAPSPHAGAWPLKTLSILADLHVQYAAAHDPAAAEAHLAEAFMAAVSTEDTAHTVDPSLPLPFANLRAPRGRARRHGITGAREDKARQ